MINRLCDRSMSQNYCSLSIRNLNRRSKIAATLDRDDDLQYQKNSDGETLKNAPSVLAVALLISRFPFSTSEAIP